MTDLPEGTFETQMSPQLVASVVPNRIKNCEGYLLIILDKMTGPQSEDNPEMHTLEPHMYIHGFADPQEVAQFLRDLANGLDPEGDDGSTGGIL